MHAENTETRTLYEVVINQERQYSIWPMGKALPPGWRTVGITGLKDTCLKFIRDNWIDMMPLSLRKKLGDADA